MYFMLQLGKNFPRLIADNGPAHQCMYMFYVEGSSFVMFLQRVVILRH